MDEEFQRPPQRVLGAMPGTLGELSERTKYPAGKVLELIVKLRRDGVRVNAIEDGARSVGRTIDREDPHISTTIFAVDSSSEKG